MNYIKHNSSGIKYCRTVLMRDRGGQIHIELLLGVSREKLFILSTQAILSERRIEIDAKLHLATSWTRRKSCYPFYTLFLVSTFIFLTIQFPSRRRSRKLFCLRRLGTESIFNVISAIAGNFDFLYTPIYKSKSISHFKYKETFSLLPITRFYTMFLFANSIILYL